MKQESQIFARRRWLPAVAPLIFVGSIDLIRAWYKHDLAEAVIVCLIFFVVGPLFSLWWQKQDWTHE
jgi:hypothetical protein